MSGAAGRLFYNDCLYKNKIIKMLGGDKFEEWIYYGGDNGAT